MNRIELLQSVLRSSLHLKKGERFAVITDTNKLDIGRDFHCAAEALGVHSTLVCIEPMQVSGEEPPQIVCDALMQSDAAVCPMSVSITHTNARLQASANGCRVVTMPGITDEMLLTGAMTADYEQVEQFTLRLTEMLSRADSATIQKDGHTLTLDLKGRRGVASTGVFRHKGNSGNLPSGEAYIAPIENGSNGSVVVDGSFGDIGLLGSPIQLTVRDGKLVDIQGQDADKLSVLRESEANATLCELGIGANYAARLRGILLEDEKAYHTIHVAFGTNDDFGGTNKATCHMDGIIKNPTLYLDDVLVMRDGEYLI